VAGSDSSEDEDGCLLGSYTVYVINALMMEAVRTSETLVNSYQTIWCNGPADNHFQLAVHSKRHRNEEYDASTNIKLPYSSRQEEEAM
jgi:hypothetical protein